MKDQTKAMALGLLTVVLWSTVATAFSITLKHLAPAQLLLVAASISTVFLLLVVVCKHQTQALKNHFRQSWLSSLLFGAVNPFLYYLVLLEAYRLLPAQEAQAINYTWAITLSFMAVPILKQKMRVHDLLAAAFCYFGVLYIATQGNPFSLQFNNSVGVMLALMSTVIWAMYWLLNTKDSRPNLIGLTLNFLFALPLIIVYCYVTDNLSGWSADGIVGATYIGLFEMGISFVLWNSALKLTDNATKVANLIFLAPILSMLWLSQLTDETIQSFTLIGLSLILVGLGLQNWQKNPSKQS